ncbi:MAG: DUF4907 domain-containing protein [Bacteroidia bacterium]|nr:DUF4907 domain-containing protein [Bacteroidia bacterium]
MIKIELAKRIALFCYILLLCACVALSLSKCSGNNKTDREEIKQNQSKKNPYAKAQIDIKTFKTDTLGWGYDIYIYKGLYVHQPHIPAINGNRGFNSEADARKVAELVVNKIRKNSMPPSVSINELDSLGVSIF